MKKSSWPDISMFRSGTAIYIMWMCARHWLHYARGICTNVSGRILTLMNVCRGSRGLTKQYQSSYEFRPSRARNNSGIEFQGNVIATILFAAPYRRHDHYFSNYDVTISRLPRITRSTANDDGAENGDEMSWNCSKDLPILVDLIAMRKA